jgi:hypothetical protein
VSLQHAKGYLSSKLYWWGHKTQMEGKLPTLLRQAEKQAYISWIVLSAN